MPCAGLDCERVGPEGDEGQTFGVIQAFRGTGLTRLSHASSLMAIVTCPWC